VSRNGPLALGKLPADLLARLLARAPMDDPRVVLGPGIGLDCAVVEAGDGLLVFKSDPITFLADDLGSYLVQVNLNDLATTGAVPRWLLVTLLLPERDTTVRRVEALFDQIHDACRDAGIAVVGGHTEITRGLDRPLAAATLIGEVSRQALVTPRGARPGDRLLLTKGVPIEAVSILAREFPDRVREAVGEAGLEEARDYRVRPGISVLADARTALAAGRITAMHDPTEGGLAGALWELALASGCTLVVDTGAVPVPRLAGDLCRAFGIDPLAAIASGALLLTCGVDDAKGVIDTLGRGGIPCTQIGEVRPGPPGVIGADEAATPLTRPAADALTRIYER